MQIRRLTLEAREEYIGINMVLISHLGISKSMLIKSCLVPLEEDTNQTLDGKVEIG